MRLLTIVGLFICLSSACSEELRTSAVLDVDGDGPDKKGNSADDTWQFWFEIAHARGTFARLSTATQSMTAAQRKSGIRRKVTGPIGGLLPNPEMSDGWIYHRDWDGRFEGVWVDRKTKAIYAHPYVEKGAHLAVAITYRIPASGVYRIGAKLTDVQVAPKFPKHDGILWRVERVPPKGKATLLGKGGPIGDGHGRPDSGTIAVEKTMLEKGDLLRLVIHPNKWWGQDLTKIESFRVEPVSP